MTIAGDTGSSEVAILAMAGSIESSEVAILPVAESTGSFRGGHLGLGTGSTGSSGLAIWVVD